MTIALSLLFFITFYRRLERDEPLSGGGGRILW